MSAVGIAGELDTDKPVEPDVVQSGEDAGEVEVALSEGQVLVDAQAHVLDRHRAEVGAGN